MVVRQDFKDLNERRIRIFFDSQSYTAIYASVTAVVFYSYFYKHNDWPQHIWLGLQLFLGIFRIMLTKVILKSQNSLVKSERLYAIPLLFTAILWGSTLHFFAFFLDQYDLLFCGLATIAVLTSSLVKMVKSKISSLTYTFGILAAFSSYFIINWSDASIMAIITSLMFSFFLAQASVHNYNSFLQAQLALNNEKIHRKQTEEQLVISHLSTSLNNISEKENIIEEKLKLIEAELQKIHPLLPIKPCAIELNKTEIEDEYSFLLKQGHTPIGRIKFFFKDIPIDKTQYKYLLGKITNLISDFLTKEQLKGEVENERNKAIHYSKLASLGELAAGVGHEINNPLAIIQGNVMILKKKFSLHEDPKGNQILTSLDKSVNRIAKIVLGLRTFTKKTDLKFKNIDLSDTLALYLNPLTEELSDFNFEFQNEIPFAQFYVFGDPGMIRDAIKILMDNSKDALNEVNTKKILIKASIEENSAKIDIIDNGKGIEKKIYDYIFDPFFTTKDVNQGTGLGLSLAHHFIKSLNGDISFKSEVNEHTVFTIKLPRSQST